MEPVTGVMRVERDDVSRQFTYGEKELHVRVLYILFFEELVLQLARLGTEVAIG
jgi:hypothetical protein